MGQPLSPRIPLSSSSSLGRAACAGCGDLIAERFLLSLDDGLWHERCVRCASCREPLRSTCFSRDRKLYCRLDYHKSKECPSRSAHGVLYLLFEDEDAPPLLRRQHGCLVGCQTENLHDECSLFIVLRCHLVLAGTEPLGWVAACMPVPDIPVACIATPGKLGTCRGPCGLLVPMLRGPVIGPLGLGPGPVGSMPLGGSMPLASVLLGGSISMGGSIPLGSMPLGSSPLGSMPLASIPLGSMPLSSMNPGSLFG